MQKGGKIMLTFMGVMKLIYGLFTAAFSDTDCSTTFTSVFHALTDSVQAIESTKYSNMTKLGKWTSLFNMAFFATTITDRNQSMRHNSAKFCKSGKSGRNTVLGKSAYNYTRFQNKVNRISKIKYDKKIHN